jgi:U4/U6.U5 tri-snRNP-associated protein 1
LHNLNISENAKTAEALELKRKGKTAGDYTGLDDDEFMEGVLGEDGKMSVLKKYDEDIDGKQETGFRLGGPAVARPANGAKGKGKATAIEEKERVKLTMDYTS